jgi:hypothetical protein
MKRFFEGVICVCVFLGVRSELLFLVINPFSKTENLTPKTQLVRSEGLVLTVGYYCCGVVFPME